MGIDRVLQKALQDGCEKYSVGIEIITVRVTKPKVPDSVMKNYEAMQNALIEAETTKTKLLAEAEAKRIVAETTIRQEKMELEFALEKQRLRADSEAYIMQKQAESNTKLFTPEYISLRWADAM